MEWETPALPAGNRGAYGVLNATCRIVRPLIPRFFFFFTLSSATSPDSAVLPLRWSAFVIRMAYIT